MALPSCRFRNFNSSRGDQTHANSRPSVSPSPRWLRSIASADALPPVRAGILQCEGGQNVGFVVGSVTSLECVFQSEGRRPEPYIATVRRFGLDLGVTDQTQLTWAVNAPTGRLRPRRTRRQLRRRRRQRVGRDRRRRQFPGRRSGEFLRAAADQRAGPDRPERRGRNRRHRTGAGSVRAMRGSRRYITIGTAIAADSAQAPMTRRPAQAGLFCSAASERVTANLAWPRMLCHREASARGMALF